MSEGWSDDELAAAVKAYRKMSRFETTQKSYSKRAIYRDLAERFGRSEKSFEYRMQNISSVLNELGMPWIQGLKPAGNIGANVRPRIVHLIDQWKEEKTRPSMLPPTYKPKLSALRDWLIAIAKCKGKVTYGQVMKAFDIDRFSLRHALSFLGHQADNLDEPILTALVVDAKTQKCSSGLAKEFAIDNDELERQRIWDFWANNFDEPIRPEITLNTLEERAARFVSVEARPDQAAFRQLVFTACSGRCVISGCDVVKAVDAAHKHGRNWRLGHNGADDGYIMRKDLHALYDSKLLWITDDGMIKLDDSVVDHYKEFLGSKIMCNV